MILQINFEENPTLWKTFHNGKSHIAIGLGIKACNTGYKTFFTTTTALINRLKESRCNKTLQILERQFMNYDLIILDEVGYISFDKDWSELLFSHLL